MEEWQVWEEVLISECLAATGKKPLGGRWVDCNKGDLSQPDVRSRWVAKDIAFYKSDEFFAATPPLEAMRLILSEAASQGETQRRPICTRWRSGRSSSSSRRSEPGLATAAVSSAPCTGHEMRRAFGRSSPRAASPSSASSAARRAPCASGTPNGRSCA